MKFFNFLKREQAVIIPVDPGLNDEERQQLCLSLKQSVDNALLRNTRFNRSSNGKVFADTKRPKTKFFKNGSGYTFLVYHPEDEHLIGGGAMMQIDVSSHQLHLFNAPYGNDVFAKIENVEGFRSMLVNKAENLSRFG